MKFEHVIEVNRYPDNDGATLDREALWQGLLSRAEDACPFVEGLDLCKIVGRTEDRLQRELHFGQTVVKDSVTLDSYQSVCFESTATDDQTGGMLTISIEEPEPGKLFLRFSYITSFDETRDENSPYTDFICSAYYQSDMDTVRIIRMMASSGHNN